MLQFYFSSDFEYFLQFCRRAKSKPIDLAYGLLYEVNRLFYAMEPHI